MLSILVALAMLANEAANANDPIPTRMEIERDILRHCAGQYPEDFTMQAACTRNARRGAADWIEIRGRYSPSTGMDRALAKCRKTYSGSGEADWTMIGACARNQERGYREVAQ